MDKGKEILDRAIREHSPRHIFVLFSGGHDSLTAAHYSMTALADHQPEIVHIDTGIGIPETQQFVIDVCARYGWPLKIYRASENTKADGTPDPMIYDDIVVRNGFPGPGAHRIMYSKLKQRQVRRLVRDHKEHRTDRVMLISGVRKAESTRRMGTTDEIQRDGAQVWVAPLLYFTGSDQWAYMVRHELPVNPVKEKLCMSGECLCGAFAHKGELREIEFWYPEVGARIRALEKRVADAGHVGNWESNRWKPAADARPTGPLCTTCDARFDAATEGGT